MKHWLSLVLVAVGSLCATASAQTTTIPFQSVPVFGPQGAHPITALTRHHGIVAWKSQWHFGIAPGPFFVDLHPYTVIIPTGATIRKGMHVIVYGHMQQEVNNPLGHPTIDASSVICLPPY